jgi:hypothetical protein
LPSCHPDIYRRNFAAWCEECNEVFGDSMLAKQHREVKKHRIKITEYLMSEPAYFSYITSILDNGTLKINSKIDIGNITLIIHCG